MVLTGLRLVKSMRSPELFLLRIEGTQLVLDVVDIGDVFGQVFLERLDGGLVGRKLGGDQGRPWRRVSLSNT